MFANTLNAYRTEYIESDSNNELKYVGLDAFCNVGSCGKIITDKDFAELCVNNDVITNIFIICKNELKIADKDRLNNGFRDSFKQIYRDKINLVLKIVAVAIFVFFACYLNYDSFHAISALFNSFKNETKV